MTGIHNLHYFVFATKMICSDCNKEFQIVQINKTKAVCICTVDCEYNKRSNIIVINRHYSSIAKPNKKEAAPTNKQDEDLDDFLLDVFNKFCNDADYNSGSEVNKSNNLQNEFSTSSSVNNLEIEPFGVNNISGSFTQPSNFGYTDVSPDLMSMLLSETNK